MQDLVKRSFKFVDMLTPCRSKVAFVLVLDPLQKQGLGHYLFFDFLQKQSQSHLNLLMLTPCRSKVTFVLGTWSPTEARSWPLFIFRLPAEAKSQSFKFVNVDPLQKQGHICSWHLIPCRSKVLAIIYFSTPCRSKVTVI